MVIPFTTDQVITLLLMFAAAVSAYAELKIGARNVKADMVVLKKTIDDLEAERTPNALLTLTVTNLSTDVRGMEHEMRNQRNALLGVEKFMARMDERMRKEHEK